MDNLKVCDEPGCGSHGVECKATGGATDTKILCNTHAKEQGFCFMCGTHAGGTYGYDQIHAGLCGRCFDDNISAYR